MNIKDITPDFLWENGINPDGMRFGPNFYPYNPKLKQFSRELRNHGQMSEALLWKCLKGKRLDISFFDRGPF